MAASTIWYVKGRENLYKGEFGDYTAGKLYIALLTSSYTPNQLTHEHWSDVSTYETSGTGYTAGGKQLSNVAVSSASKVIKISADSPEWASSTFTARYAVIYCRAGASAASTDHLMVLMDFGENKSSSGTTFKVNIATSGIFDDTVN